MKTKRFVKTVEVLVVVAVIGIVVAVLLKWLFGALYKSYESVALQEARHEYTLFYAEDTVTVVNNSYVIKAEKEGRIYYYTIINGQFIDTLYESEAKAKEAANITSFTKDLTQDMKEENPNVKIFGKAK